MSAFVDEAQLNVRGGDGGFGCAFQRSDTLLRVCKLGFVAGTIQAGFFSCADAAPERGDGIFDLLDFSLEPADQRLVVCLCGIFCGHRLGQGPVVGGEDHPGALPGLLQDLQKEPPPLLVQGRLRLVQKPEVGPQEEEAGEGEALLHPAGEGGEGKVRGKGEAGQGRLPVPLRPVETQVKEEVLPGGEVAVEGRGVGEEEGPSPSLHPAPGGPYKPRHEAEEGGLARAVRAQEGHHLSPL